MLNPRARQRPVVGVSGIRGWRKPVLLAFLEEV
jgi:hypothetical protein